MRYARAQMRVAGLLLKMSEAEDCEEQSVAEQIGIIAESEHSRLGVV